MPVERRKADLLRLLVHYRHRLEIGCRFTETYTHLGKSNSNDLTKNSTPSRRSAQSHKTGTPLLSRVIVFHSEMSRGTSKKRTAQLREVAEPTGRRGPSRRRESRFVAKYYKKRRPQAPTGPAGASISSDRPATIRQIRPPAFGSLLRRRRRPSRSVRHPRSRRSRPASALFRCRLRRSV